MAGDLATGEAVVLRSGNLARSLRASMSIPAALAPIEIDGRLLVDGGIAMNLPVDVARQMGADVVIAVDISSTLLTRDTLRSVLDVTSQLTNLLTRAGNDEQRRKLRGDDILLRPEFGEDLSSVSFARMSEAIQAGYDAVMAHRAEFEALALSEADYSAYLAGRTDPRMRELPVDRLRAPRQQRRRLPTASCRRGSRTSASASHSTSTPSRRAINKVYGLEYYQNVRYGLVQDGGKTGLEVELDKRSWGPNYLQLGMEYSSAGKGDALFGLAASYLGTAINDRGGEWRATLVIGDEPALAHESLSAVRTQGPVLRRAGARSRIDPVSTCTTATIGCSQAQKRQATLELAVGRELPSWGEYRFGIREASGSYELRVGDPAYMPDENFRVGELFGRFSVDTMDSVSFPRQGTLASLEWRGSRRGPLSADADFDQVLVSARAREDLGPVHDPDVVALRRDDQRHCAGQRPVPHGRLLRSFGHQSQPARGPVRGARSARATTGASAISRCFRRSPE